ncbi:D-arabinono-1,4-lactone oxidase [Nocardioides sp. cx-173]|uniref:D-arabinono-1,4-lactone oxidase n=1 Tax=Nocardioides sp. cx-173 TaxID=2898796 RepID=UPI001E4FB6FC|nr:D-arabinono-1,4-lactone oxidase [Nocardioides sp. cx-173]MCD4524788.1 FAD-binding protein [Nocardioides sp. cx-173]UGB43296.1 FAD-binding protein [Nocardioides sp. cx-173]
MLTNWSGNHRYAAARRHRPATVEELQTIVAGADRVHALGSRHSFTDVADTPGDLISTAGLPVEVEIDAHRRQVRASGGATYGRLAAELQAEGWALASMASLPHISVAGAVATGTHGSGDRNGSLAAAVAGLDLVAADGSLRRVRRGDPDADGQVVALGALGVTTHVTLDIEPTYEVRQDLFTGLPWDVATEHLDALTASASSVSLFTDWVSGTVGQVWLKSRDTTPPPDLFGAPAATSTLHMLAGADAAAVTEQGGRPGPWHERLPHFRMEFTPSRGEELQSEYLVPRAHAAAAFEALRSLAGTFAPLLQVSEVRTVAADELWLSGTYGTDVVALHFTWVRDVAAVYDVLPGIEAALLPLGARPHWGKCFAATASELRPLYPRFDDFRELALRSDPDGVFRSDFLARTLDLS